MSILCSLWSHPLIIFIIISIAITGYIVVKLRKSTVERDAAIFYICLISLIVMWSGSAYYYTYKNLNRVNSQQAVKAQLSYNEIGDSMGTINALFSGLGLAGIILAIILQMKELKETRKELQAQREELHAQMEELNKQNRTSMLARFENSFFNLLEAQRVIGNRINFNHQQTIYHQDKSLVGNIGIVSFKKLYEQIFTTNIVSDTLFTVVNQIPKELTQITKLRYYKKLLIKNILGASHRGEFDSYFRITYRILRFIDTYKMDFENAKSLTLTDDEKDYYAGILRAQLSAFEIICIFYNSLIPEYADAKVLYEKYRLFNSLRFDLLYTPFDLLFYSPTSFSDKNQRGDDIPPAKIKEFYTKLLDNLIIYEDMNDRDKECYKDNLYKLVDLYAVFYENWLGSPVIFLEKLDIAPDIPSKLPGLD